MRLFRQIEVVMPRVNSHDWTIRGAKNIFEPPALHVAVSQVDGDKHLFSEARRENVKKGNELSRSGTGPGWRGRG